MNAVTAVRGLVRRHRGGHTLKPARSHDGQELRLARYRAAHPRVRVSSGPGCWQAEIPGLDGELTSIIRSTLQALLDELDCPQAVSRPGPVFGEAPVAEVLEVQDGPAAMPALLAAPAQPFTRLASVPAAETTLADFDGPAGMNRRYVAAVPAPETAVLPEFALDAGSEPLFHQMVRERQRHPGAPAGTRCAGCGYWARGVTSQIRAADLDEHVIGELYGSALGRFHLPRRAGMRAA